MGDEPPAEAALPRLEDDGGLAVVRIKPLGAGGGGIEASASGHAAAVRSTESGGLRVAAPGGGGHGRQFSYPRHVVEPGSTQEQVYEMFMPARVEAFLRGVNVNIMCYGQTGSGKTHSMFGPPGLMAEAGAGRFGADVCPDYGLCPRGLLDIVGRLQRLRREGGDWRYELTASAVELTVTEGNLDMFSKARRSSLQFCAEAQGVCIDRTVKPPLLYGMTEVPIDGAESLLALFRAIASRNTAGTGLNDSSSRSHCFVFLHLYACNAVAGTLRTSRFQFVDLAGSERLKDAHQGFKERNLGTIEGMNTNYGLMMLSQRVRELAAASKAGKRREELVQRSFKTQLDPDLLVLLAESLTGAALSLIMVCVSSAPDNASQSVNALNFGEVFSRLAVRAAPVPEAPLGDVRRRAEALLASGRAGQTGGTSKYALIRQAQGRAGEQLQTILARLGTDPAAAAAATAAG